MEEIKIGILGGSGLYAMDTLKNIKELQIDTPFGKTSDAIITGDIDGVGVAFMARHGRSHSLLPSEVPYKANIFAMKKLGIRYLLSVSAVGSLKEEMKPRDVVIPNQYIDYTKHRDMTFFGNGMVAHVSIAQPTCQALSDILVKVTQVFTKDTIVKGSSNKDDGKDNINKNSTVNANANNETRINVHAGGTYICIEGPQFSSFAESSLFRSMGADIIGMTNMPEAKLAREAQIAYATLAMVTDYDCWHPHEEAVTADMTIANLKANANLAQNIIKETVMRISATSPISIAHSALKQALITPIEAMNKEQKEIMAILSK